MENSYNKVFKKLFYLFIISFLVICIQSCIRGCFNKKEFKSIKYPIIKQDQCIDTIQYNFDKQDFVTLTVYYPVSSQCNKDSLHTADNSFINLDKLKSNKIKWCALSRDLLKRWGGCYNYGDTIQVNSSDININGKWVIHDTMNKRYSKRIDLLFYPNQYVTKLDSTLICKI